MASSSLRRTASAEPTVWTVARKWRGNLVPLAIWFMPTSIGVGHMLWRAEVSPIGAILVFAGTVMGWVATNYLGPTGNAQMRAQLVKILHDRGEAVAEDEWFVGFATPRYSSALDPHEDIGFLSFEGATLQFRSETRSIDLARSDVTRIAFRPNIHTWVGLGRWVTIDGEVDSTPVRLYLEPRTQPTLLGNLLASKRLFVALKKWQVRYA